MENSKVNFDNVEAATSEIKKVDSAVTVEKLIPHLSSEKKVQAQIRMTVNTTYPEAKVGNSLNASIFGADEFGFGDGQNFDEKRVAWIDVPAAITLAQVREKMATIKDARLYRTISLEPILTEEQVRAMDTGLSTRTDKDGVVTPIDMDYYKDRQVVRQSTENPEDVGEIRLYKELPQYRVIAFSDNSKADIDLRPAQYAGMMKPEAEEVFKLTDKAVKSKENVAGKF